jgi:predicted heme/steroid binding protein
MRHLLFLLLLVASAFLLLSAPAEASPEYARSTGQVCSTCHISPTGGALSETGLDFAASGYVWPPTKNGYRTLTPIKKPVRLFVGFLHMLAAFMWLGTILYVHIMLRPGYASKGLPKGEVFLGLAAMTIVGATGVLLTISRINSISILYETRWGVLLLLKMLIYITMILSAAIVVTVIGPRLRRTKKELPPPKDGVFDPATLAAFDGKEGRQAFVAYNKKVYDVSSSRLWKEGSHMRLHAAGSDQTASLLKAPHGADKIEVFRCVGSYDPAKKVLKTPVQKAFYFVAYMNLALVFCVIFVIAIWRWGG